MFMVIDRISYIKTFQVGISNWEKVGMEAALLDGDIYEECFNELKKEVESFHRNSNPQLYSENESIVSSFTGTKHSPETRSNSIADQIRTCTEIKVLESYKPIAKASPELQEVYDEMLKKLSV